ncbi:MAG TPA: hypothetical protein PKB02_13395 [Anaerohalosphaeraceae bacterium]|jgi:preprotein translocase subunit SecG|nr:hypothetical protein [Anaerohalosphaeraceae bacterium]
MLSFLKDGQTLPASADMNPSDTSEGSVTRQEDYLTVAGHSKKLKQSTILLIALFAIGGISVLLMVKKATPSQAAAAQQKEEQLEIETAIAQLSGMQSEVNKEMKNVTGRLNHLSEVGQIDVKDLKKNPFTREMTSGEISLDNRTQMQILMEQARKQAAGLELWSITASPRGACCMINDKVLYAGDEINGFKVSEIGKQKVTLERDGARVELKMN